MLPYPEFHGQSSLPMFVMDVMRHDDCENIPSILNLLRDDSGTIGWKDMRPEGFTEYEVTEALRYCISQGLVIRLQYSPDREALVQTNRNIEPGERIEHEEVWFSLTPKGKHVLAAWIPPDQYVN